MLLNTRWLLAKQATPLQRKPKFRLFVGSFADFQEWFPLTLSRLEKKGETRP
jgi:hypothetical protein